MADAQSSGSDEDAEGSEDAEYELEHTPPPVADHHSSTRSSSPQSSLSSKPPNSYDEANDWRKNPELYGIRRSVSAAMLSRGGPR